MTATARSGSPPVRTGGLLRCCWRFIGVRVRRVRAALARSAMQGLFPTRTVQKRCRWPTVGADTARTSAPPENASANAVHREQRTGVDFPDRGNVVMTQDIGEPILLVQQLSDCSHGRDLNVRVFMPASRFRLVLVSCNRDVRSGNQLLRFGEPLAIRPLPQLARVDQFDPDRALVQARQQSPLADPGMPGTLVERNQLDDTASEKSSPRQRTAVRTFPSTSVREARGSAISAAADHQALSSPRAPAARAERSRRRNPPARRDSAGGLRSREPGRWRPLLHAG